MRLTMNDSRWSTLLRGALVTLFSIFVLSFITLILSGIWGKDMTDASYTPASGKPSKAHLVFYTGTMPFLTIFWAALDIGFASLSSLSPVHALVSSIILLCGWLIQFSIWMKCEVQAPNMSESFQGVMWCPNAQLSSHKNGAGSFGDARSWIGLVIVVAVFIYMVLAAVSVSRNRKAARTSLPYRKDPERQLQSMSS